MQGLCPEEKVQVLPKCEICTKCTLCSSHCHWNFSKRAQFFNQKDQIELKVNCEDLVGDDEVHFAKETKWIFGKQEIGDVGVQG